MQVSLQLQQREEVGITYDEALMNQNLQLVNYCQIIIENFEIKLTRNGGADHVIPVLIIHGQALLKFTS